MCVCIFTCMCLHTQLTWRQSDLWTYNSFHRLNWFLDKKWGIIVCKKRLSSHYPQVHIGDEWSGKSRKLKTTTNKNQTNGKITSHPNQCNEAVVLDRFEEPSSTFPGSNVHYFLPRLLYHLPNSFPLWNSPVHLFIPLISSRVIFLEQYVK